MRRQTNTLLLLAILSLCTGDIFADDLPVFDFATSAGVEGWRAAHDISNLQPTAEGLLVQISGSDPYLMGPARDYPAGKILWLHLRLKSDQSGVCQVFYYRGGSTERDSVRFSVPGGQWYEAQVPLPALGLGYHLRIDPPGSGGTCVLARLSFSERVRFSLPVWPKPEPFTARANALTIQSGSLKLIHNRTALGSFALQVGGQTMATGNAQGLIGYLYEGKVRWFSLTNDRANPFTIKSQRWQVTASSRQTDPSGARWEVIQTFAAREGAIDVETRVTVDRERSVLYLPMLTLLPGLGSFGTNKYQALFPGLEYLENEPSSSEADLVGPESRRQVPDTLKITFPLMAIQAAGSYVGLIWEPQPNFCAVFDSPDRLFGANGHVMGVLFPGCDGMHREEGNLLPYKPETIAANKTLTLRATLIGDPGTSVAPAIEQYVKLHPLPTLPDSGLAAPEYFSLAAHGWLDSKIREGDLYRHAAATGFGAQPSADAALWMNWLADHVTDGPLAARLTNAATAALTRVAPQNYNGTQIGHIRTPLPALVFGSVSQNANQALAHGRALLGRFQSDGSVLYPPPAKGVDYGKTHWAREANGLTATVVITLLEAAAFSGDRPLLEQALQHLRAMDKFKDTVPRGAQTWEVPLHTPDVLASAYLLRAYTLGYELTGDTDFLDQARYWAWTGVPFVYLSPPSAQPVGVYSTIAVFGATGWTAPVWMGLPVQWCGLVYGDALYRFARHDPDGPWKKLADGIAVAGVQHTWPVSGREFQGLLPDSFQLHAQIRNGPAINPATVQVPAMNYFEQAPPYSFRAIPRLGWLIHAAGDIREWTERPDGIKFTVTGWPGHQTWLLVNGVREQPRVKINGKDTPLASPAEYEGATGRLILQIQNPAVIEIRL